MRIVYAKTWPKNTLNTFDAMKCKSLFPVLLCALLSFCAPAFAQSLVIPFLTNTATGSLTSTFYRCDEMVQSINRLRHLGKAQAIEVLKSDIQQHGDDMKIMCICRLLFVNTNGWKPVEGADFYREMVHTNILGQFPLFPMALSEGVPFFIFRGFDVDGRLAEEGADDLQLCEAFPMIPADLPEFNYHDYQKAALKLIRSEPFLKLYKVPDYTESDYTIGLIYEILWQTDMPGRRL
jgi:hypothetical protein